MIQPGGTVPSAIDVERFGPRQRAHDARARFARKGADRGLDRARLFGCAPRRA